MLSIYAFIQARLNSTRLPKKILKPIPQSSEVSILDHIYNRLQKVLDPSNIVFLLPSNDLELVNYCISKKYYYFLGSEDDVRDRYISAGLHYNADIIIRLTGDNPFIDVEHIELLIETFIGSNTDVMSFESLPIGMGVEIFYLKSIQKEPKSGLLDKHKEHVSLHLKEYPEEFSFVKLKPLLKESEIEITKQIRITIDEEKDYLMACELYQIASKINSFFGVKEVIHIFKEHPEIFKINQMVNQVTFPIFSEKRKKKSIFILYAEPSKYGSGHYERSRLLSLKLQSIGYPVYMDFFLPKALEDSLYIIDHRDFEIPLKLTDKKILLVDNFGPSRNHYPFVDVLPHPDTDLNKSIESILIPKIIQSLQNKENKTVVVYSGSIPEDQCDKLDQFIGSIFPTYNKIRIGGTSPKDSSIQHYKRLFRLEYLRLIAGSEIFISYFGQSIMEAIYLNKKVLLFSISDYHKKITEFFCKHSGLFFMGDIATEKLNQPNAREIAQSKLLVKESGYDNLLQLIQKYIGD